MQKKAFLIIFLIAAFISIVVGVLAGLLYNRTSTKSTATSNSSVATTSTVSSSETKAASSAVFLHHSTGENIWNGGVPAYFDKYNDDMGTDFQISELAFPSDEYGWENYPYDYWNIWVNHGGESMYMGQPTLDDLTKTYDVIIWKHCFPVGYIEEGYGDGDVASSDKTLSNYKLQYEALKLKMYDYPDTMFIVWTGAALIQSETDSVQAQRTQEFVTWVKNTWDKDGDNIYIFDFYELETEGGVYMKEEYSSGDSHPDEAFSRAVAPIFSQFVIDIIEGN